MTLGQKRTCWLFIHSKLLKYETNRIEVLEFVSSVKQNQSVEWSKVVPVAVEVSPMGSKPPAAVVVRISKGERHDLDAVVPLSTTTPSLQGRAGGSTFTPNMVEHIGSGSTLGKKHIPMHCLYCFSGTLRARIFVSNGLSTSIPRRGCRASCSRPAKRCPVPLISSASTSI